MEGKRYCISWGRDRREVEAYLYGGNEIIAEYERPDSSTTSSYFALIECSAGGGFGAVAQAGRLASGTIGGGEPLTLAEAEHNLRELFGAIALDGPSAPAPGNRSRPSGLAERSCAGVV